MRISDWSSDVCSSDLLPRFDLAPGGGCRAAEVALDAGALLPHRFTLACAPVSRGHRRSALCCPVPTGRPALALASTLALRSPDLPRRGQATPRPPRSEEHTSELQSLMRRSNAVFR